MLLLDEGRSELMVLGARVPLIISVLLVFSFPCHVTQTGGARTVGTTFYLVWSSAVISIVAGKGGEGENKQASTKQQLHVGYVLVAEQQSCVASKPENPL